MDTGVFAGATNPLVIIGAVLLRSWEGFGLPDEGFSSRLLVISVITVALIFLFDY